MYTIDILCTYIYADRLHLGRYACKLKHVTRTMYGTEAQDIYAACKEGDESFVRQWLSRAENDVNRGLVRGAIHY